MMIHQLIKKPFKSKRLKTDFYICLKTISILILSAMINLASSVMTYHLAFGGIYTILDTGELLDPESNKVNISMHWVGNNNIGSEGLIMTSYLEIPVLESSSWQIGLGRGKDSLQINNTWKWIPIPDYEKQPAVGALLGFTYIYKSFTHSQSAVGLYAQPIISKRFSTPFGDFIPYTGFLLGLTSQMDYKAEYSMKLSFGSEVFLKDTAKWSFILEGGLNIYNNAHSMSLGINYLF